PTKLGVLNILIADTAAARRTDSIDKIIVKQ
ncbi:MAG: hypothetical protein UW01_C0017G0001, partial [Candidatus Nomurabacteria bacterium GW2011_GWA2_43_66]